MKKTFLNYLIGLLCLLMSSSASALNVVYVLPDYEEHQFWYWVADVVRAVGKQQQIELESYHVSNNRFTLAEKITEVAERTRKPDYVVFRPFQGSSQLVFETLERAQIPFITLERVFEGKEAELLQRPQQAFQFWLDEIEYDQKNAGAKLAEKLHKEFSKEHAGKVAQLTGLGGVYDRVSSGREDGLRSYLRQTKKIVLNQVFPMQFSQAVLSQRFSRVLSRYPDTDIFWCASAQMALEVNLQSGKSTSGKKWYIGAFDWLPEAVEQIKAGKITALVGGHFLMGAQALINIIEKDRQQTSLIKDYQFELIDAANVAQFSPFIKQHKWQQADYSKFILSTNNQNPPVLSVQNLIELGN
ncbi:substrate-binding domain-containing protein [Catenovulum agarivorans]|uniref:substrate-binding domain-containing protein n=1 Tax=Catenovulum agarivorans TaxID=1172192 RepID=UPI0003810A12|nr:substrate-binding domain-containing protein [Catenovulum agarivorans]